MSKALNIASVATGSTADISEPNAKLSLTLNEYIKFILPNKKTPAPIVKALIAVPIIAKTSIDPIF